MKRLLTFLLAGMLLLGCCGCKLIDKIQSGLEETVSSYRDHSGAFGELVSADGEDAVSVNDGEYDHSPYDHNYAELNAQQQQIYRYMYAGAAHAVTGWFRVGKCGVDYQQDLVLAFQALSNDRPELFWLPFHYLYSNCGSEEKPDVLVAFSYRDDDYEIDYLIEPEKLQRAIDRVDAAVNDALRGMPRNVFDAEKYLHDYICDRVTYCDTDDDPSIYTVYGALVNQSAVCEGYAHTMQLLCRCAGIPCNVIVGDFNGIGHMWNVIKVDRDWYHLDVTWDDAPKAGGIIYSFFNLDDRQIQKDHIICKIADGLRSDELKNGRFNLFLPTCDADRCQYYNYLGLSVAGKDPAAIARKIVSADRSGETELQVYLESSGYLNSFTANAQSAATEIQRELRSLGSSVSLKNLMTYGNLLTLYWD